MPTQPQPLSQPKPPAPEFRPLDTSAQRRERQLAHLQRLADLTMEAAEIAGENLRAREPVQPGTASPAVDLARATRSMTIVITLEARVESGDILRRTPLAPAAAAPNPIDPAVRSDPRRLPLREALHEAVKTEPDRTIRAKMRRRIDQRIDDELAADPDQDLRLSDLLFPIAKDLQIKLDASKLHDAFFNIPERTRPADGSALWARYEHTDEPILPPPNTHDPPKT